MGIDNNDMNSVRLPCFALLSAIFILIVSFCSRYEILYESAENGPDCAEYLIDLNNATGAELTLIPGIGPKLAKEIIRVRESRGGFCSLDELKMVKGIGVVKTAGASEWVFIGDRINNPETGRGNNSLCTPSF